MCPIDSYQYMLRKLNQRKGDLEPLTKKRKHQRKAVKVKKPRNPRKKVSLHDRVKPHWLQYYTPSGDIEINLTDENSSIGVQGVKKVVFKQKDVTIHGPVRTLDDMSEAEKSALCSQYNTNIVSRK